MRLKFISIEEKNQALLALFGWCNEKKYAEKLAHLFVGKRNKEEPKPENSTLKQISSSQNVFFTNENNSSESKFQLERKTLKTKVTSLTKELGKTLLN